MIYRSLDDHAEETKVGAAFTDNMGFTVPELSSGRQSFSPDASYYIGPPPQDDMDFVDGPPTLAVEVRSKGDYGPAAEAKMAAKRADYFEAGTKVVWDVDPEAELIQCYRARPLTAQRCSPLGKPLMPSPPSPVLRLSLDRVFA